MKLKNLSSVILAAMMAATSVPCAGLVPYSNMNAYAVETAEPEEEAYIASGLCGENLTWEVFAEEDSLVIDGTGAMTEWENAEDAPWAEYGDRISLIVIRENVESISENAFGATCGRTFYFHGYNCVIPDSETFLPENAIIMGYNGSTAQTYAEKYNMHFTAIRTEIVSGEFGEGFEWMIFDDNSILIDGVGKMPEYEAGNYPWSDYSDMIKSISLAKEVTSIGAYAFYNCTNLETIHLAPVIGEHAYDGCINVYGVGSYSDIPVNEIGDYAFNNCGFFSYQFTNPDCVIADSEYVFPAGAIIEGYVGSTAQAYAEKYNRQFEEVPEIALGDVNEDGQVNSSDASIVLAEYAAAQIGNTSSFTENQTKAADVNGDGVVNSADASEILRYYSEASTGKEAVWNLV